MAERKYVYRLVVDSWPTEDGRPFVVQSDEFWEAIAACAEQGHADPECECPDWLPDLSRLRPYLAHPATYDCPREVIQPPRFTRVLGVGYEPGDPVTGYGGCPDTVVMAIPVAHARRFLQSAGPVAMSVQLREWGCCAHVERAQLGAWETING